MKRNLRVFFDNNFDSYDIQRLVNTPIWVAYSSDDTNVKIDSVDYCVAELQKFVADIKYTRWSEYGHFYYQWEFLFLYYHSTTGRVTFQIF